jgi:hypothetical protein
VAEAITLYLGLKPGEKADFEVVGLAAAAFAEAVKEIAYILEPATEVRLEFESGLEGSLELKAILRKLGSREARGVLIGIVATVGIVLANDIETYGVGKFLDHYLMLEQRQQLSDEDIERIVRAVRGVNDGQIAKAPVREMYRQLDRDKNIESVGSIAKPDAKPINPIPRSEFSTRAGLAPVVETTPRSRRSVRTDLLTVISAVFLNTDRVWRFRSAFGEDSYHVADLKFLSDVLSGKFKLKEGVQITAQVESIEEFEGGVWVPKRHTILKVIRRHRQHKADLFSTSQKKSTPKKKKPAGPKRRAPTNPLGKTKNKAS